MISDPSTQKRLSYAYLLSQMSQFALLVLLVLHHRHLPYSASALFAWLLCFALIAALPGIIKANPYTFGWNGFTLILIFIHGITQLFSYAHPSKLISLIIFLSLVNFCASIYFARTRGRQLGLSLRKKKG
jgi:uncharacterized membrane protein|tara:strand:+ start:238 stop:627 length:390 start_codon:yes stop_codon:yes gene_type:complete